MEEEWEQDDNEAVEEILGRYPEARDFLPLIKASTVAEFEGVASSIASKVRNMKSKENQQTSPPRNPKPKPEEDS